MYPEPTFNQRKDSLIERRTKNAKKSKSMANRKAKRGLQVEKSLNKRSKVCSWSWLINFFAFFNLRKLCRNRTVGVPRALKSAVYAGRYIPATECSWISKIYLAGRGCGWQMRLHPLALLDATQSSIIFLFLSSFTVKKKAGSVWITVVEKCFRILRRVLWFDIVDVSVFRTPDGCWKKASGFFEAILRPCCSVTRLHFMNFYRGGCFVLIRG